MPIPKKTSPYRRHVAKWESCVACPLCTNRSKTVFTRGSVPCDVLFIGEAPGPSEDVIGKPFIGPAGKFLDELIFDATYINTLKQTATKIAFTNLVACLPESVEDKIQPPNEVAIKKCYPRLKEFVTICNPSIVILTGKLASDFFPRKQFPNISFFEILHPASILGLDTSCRGLAIKRTVDMIKKAFDSLCPF